MAGVELTPLGHFVLRGLIVIGTVLTGDLLLAAAYERPVLLDDFKLQAGLGLTAIILAMIVYNPPNSGGPHRPA